MSFTSRIAVTASILVSGCVVGAARSMASAESAAQLATLLQQASPSPLVKYLPLPEETHATIYHPAALQALRTLFPAPPQASP